MELQMAKCDMCGDECDSRYSPMYCYTECGEIFVPITNYTINNTS